MSPWVHVQIWRARKDVCSNCGWGLVLDEWNQSRCHNPCCRVSWEIKDKDDDL